MKTYTDCSAEGRRWHHALQFTAFAAILFGIKLWLIGTFGNATPFWDQWGAEADRLYRPYLGGVLTWGDLVEPHNEHRILTTRLLDLLLLVVGGVWNPLLQMVVNAVLHIAGLAITVALLCKATSQRNVAALLVFAGIVFAIPYAWENVLAGFQAQFYLVVLFSVPALWLCVTREPLSGGWWIGVASCILAFFSLASGVFAAGTAAAVGALWLAMGVRREPKQVWAVLILIGMCVAGLVLTPSHPGHEQLRASSPGQFFEAQVAVLSWPMAQGILAALARNAPALVFTFWMIRSRAPAGSCRWFLFALVFWSLMQGASIAYGRAVGSGASRYLDLFAIALVVNFACLLSMAREFKTWRRSVVVVAACIWTMLIGGSMAIDAVKRIPTELRAKREMGIVQEQNVRAYLDTGRFEWLANKPPFHVPFPWPDRLAAILASPQLRAILPSNIRPALKAMRVDQSPQAAFVSGGFYPATPAPEGFSIGSYGAQGDASTGEVHVHFDPGRSGLLAIPISGYPLNAGIKVELEQAGKRRSLVMGVNPRESWALAYARVEEGPFSVVLTDTSPSTWVAMGAPRLTFGSELFVNRLLEIHFAFLGLGLSLVVLASALSRRLVSILPLSAPGRALSPGSWPKATVLAFLAIGSLWLASKAALLLTAMALWHAALIALPVACATMIALRSGIGDRVLLAAWGLAGGGLVTYIQFWVWLASPTLGAISGMCVLLACAAIIARIAASIEREKFALMAPFGKAAAVWLLYGIFVLAFGLAPSDLERPLSAVATRFVHELPIDNQIPYLFAQQVTSGQVLKPMIGDWLSSDRPPLQTAYFLASGASLLPRSDLHYQVQSTLLQALWVLGLWLTLAALRLRGLPVFLALLACMFSGIALLHGIYTWPKLLPVMYVGMAAAIFFHPLRSTLDDWRAGLVAGTAGALAVLSHGSSSFALLGLGLTALALKRIPSARFIASAILAAIVFMGPWSFYQSVIDPPGNRLAKWHLAGVVPIDNRGLVQTLRDSYGARSLRRVVELKNANLATLLGEIGKWPALMAKTVSGKASDSEAMALKAAQFFYLAPALGLFILGPAALLARRSWKSPAAVAAVILIILSVVITLIWSGAMFGPGTTILHQGSLALPLFAAAGCVLAMIALSPALACLVVFLQLLLTFVLYVARMPGTVDASLNGLRQFDSLLALAAIAFFLTVWALWRLAHEDSDALEEPSLG